MGTEQEINQRPVLDSIKGCREKDRPCDYESEDRKAFLSPGRTRSNEHASDSYEQWKYNKIQVTQSELDSCINPSSSTPRVNNCPCDVDISREFRR